MELCAFLCCVSQSINLLLVFNVVYGCVMGLFLFPFVMGSVMVFFCDNVCRCGYRL